MSARSSLASAPLTPAILVVPLASGFCTYMYTYTHTHTHNHAPARARASSLDTTRGAAAARFAAALASLGLAERAEAGGIFRVSAYMDPQNHVRQWPFYCLWAISLP